MPNKICHVNLARGFRGGERQTQLLIQALGKKGLQQVLLARANSPLHEKLAGTPGLEHYRLKNTHFAGLSWIGKYQPALVHAHDARAAQWALLNYWRRKTPYLITRRVPNPLGENPFTRAVYRNAATVVGLSSAIKASIKRLLPNREVEVIPSMFASFAVEQGRVAQLQNQYQGQFVVGHIGALVDRHKGQSVIIEAARLLKPKYPNLKFVLLGEGEDEGMLKQFAEGLDNIEFVGFVSDVGSWISVFDLFVFPSFNEGLGSTLLDVMQQSKAIIASAVDGILDVIKDGENGLLVGKNKPQQLAEAIERVYLDADLRQRLGLAGHQGLSKYSPERISECYYMEYQKIVTASEASNENKITKI